MKVGKQWQIWNGWRFSYTRLHHKAWKKQHEEQNEWIGGYNVMLPVVLNNFWLFKYELSFLVPLGRFISSFILPTQHFTAITTINISNSVEASQEMSVFFWPRHNIHCMGKQKGSPISSLIIKFRTTIQEKWPRKAFLADNIINLKSKFKYQEQPNENIQRSCGNIFV